MANNKKSKKKIIIFSAGGVVLIVLALLVFLGSKKETVLTVQTEKVQQRTITQTVTATGKIYPEVQVVISPEVSGEIIDLPVKLGMKVKKGQTLMHIKPDIYVAMRDQAAAQLTSAKASLDKSESEYNRAKNLFVKGLIATSDLELGKTNFEVARSQHDQAEASLKQSNESLKKTTIYAPMDGIISDLNVELGQRVLGTVQFQGTTVMTVADLSRMEARVDVGENDVILIALKDTVRVEVDAFRDKKLIGIVYQIGNTAKTKGLGTQEEVTNFEVRIRIIDKDIQLKPGMSMTAVIETETKQNVISVPIQSVTTRSANKEKNKEKSSSEGDEMASNDSRIKEKTEKPKEVVFIIDNEKAKMLEVKRGISDDSYTEIVTGLKGSEQVISGSYKAISRELEDGVKIKVESEKKKTEKVASK